MIDAGVNLDRVDIGPVWYPLFNYIELAWWGIGL
jgi:hypothetical protein